MVIALRRPAAVIFFSTAYFIMTFPDFCGDVLEIETIRGTLVEQEIASFCWRLKCLAQRIPEVVGEDLPRNALESKVWGN